MDESKTNHSIPFHPLLLSTEGKGNLERGTKSSFAAFIVFLLSDEGKTPPAVRQPKN